RWTLIAYILRVIPTRNEEESLRKLNHCADFPQSPLAALRGDVTTYVLDLFHFDSEVGISVN
ncbi:MAG: hypothetical protein KIH69_004425, partial [Anaerolineae bacterium]|nr:hypothetical protein [Anaerolineae bacterium]